MELIKPTPWDADVFKIPTWELLEYSEAALNAADSRGGHFTIKINPLADKRLLHEYGFYYCDTLIEPYCEISRFRPAQHPEATIIEHINFDSILDICHGAFIHGRFHRDFNLSKASADLRYDNWLKQLIESGQIYGLCWRGVLAGFIGFSGTSLVLHAVASDYRGKGISKYWWSEVCLRMMKHGEKEVTSSISATNLAILGLYSSLGFAFRNAQDVYHRVKV